MLSLWRRGGLSWAELARRTWEQCGRDGIFGRSAELAFYFLLSFFPLLLCLTALFGAVMSDAQLQRSLFEYLRRVVPNQAVLTLLRETLAEIVAARGQKFSWGLLTSLWIAAQGLAAVGRSLDTIYEIEDRRSFLLRQVTAIALTVAASVLVFTALALLFYGSTIIAWLAGHVELGGALLVAVWGLLRWPVILLFVLTAFELIYNYAPGGTGSRKLHWLSPGGAVGVGVWLSASLGFRLYLSRFDLYSWTYGSLGALIVLLLWFYFSGFALLLGGEVNSEIHKALGGSGDPGEPAPAVSG